MDQSLLSEMVMFMNRESGPAYKHRGFYNQLEALLFNHIIIEAGVKTK